MIDWRKAHSFGIVDAWQFLGIYSRAVRHVVSSLLIAIPLPRFVSPRNEVLHRVRLNDDDGIRSSKDSVSYKNQIFTRKQTRA